MKRPSNQTAKSRKGLVAQLGSFGLVGVLNTVLDFAIFNTCLFLFGFSTVPANLVSTTIAQVISFALNKKFVFAGVKIGRSRTNTIVRFVLVTAIGLYVIQSIVLTVFMHYIIWPGQVVHEALQLVGIQVTWDFAINNTAKIIATVFSAAWNFVLYKKVVFGGKAKK